MQCIDPRDKIYPVLSLTSTKVLRANYSMTTKEIYQSFGDWALGASSVQDSVARAFKKGKEKTAFMT